MMMQRQLVISSELHSVGYDDANNVLEVEFRTGGVYQYFGVPRESYVALMAAMSKGRFFNTQIKPAYRCMRTE
jgi:KTSC domain